MGSEEALPSGVRTVVTTPLGIRESRLYLVPRRGTVGRIGCLNRKSRTSRFSYWVRTQRWMRARGSGFEGDDLKPGNTASGQRLRHRQHPRAVSAQGRSRRCGGLAYAHVRRFISGFLNAAETLEEERFFRR